jgi:hypothetical protein
MFTAAKIRNIFQSNKLFRVNMRFWSPLLTFNVVRQDFGQEKKSGLRFRVNHVYIHAFINSIKRT